MSETEPKASNSINFKQLIATLVIVAGLLLIAAVIFIQREMAFQQAAASWATQKFGFDEPITNRLAPEFVDEDQDLVADAPQDANQHVTPDVIRFCYIPSWSEEHGQATWGPFVDHLSEQLGRPVEYLEVPSVDAQLAALKTGYLHVTGLNTGSVPRAVNVCGFVPVCTIAAGDGSYGYKMQLIVPASSDVQKPTDLKGKRITFVNPSSNSGFKAPVVLLKQHFDMRIDEDYTYGFSTSHDNSILGIKNGEFKAAAVASDVLARMVAQGEIADTDYRVVYESERFPPAAIGYVHQLAPELAETVVASLVNFPLDGTDLKEQLTAEPTASFAAVSYKDDWAIIRMIDDAQGTKHAVNPDAFAPEQQSREPVKSDAPTLETTAEPNQVGSVDDG